MSPIISAPRLIVALDYADLDYALAFLDKCSPDQCRVKIGHELFTKAGVNAIKTIQSRGFDIFLDLKYHDIPNTVAASVARAAELGVWMVNVHCLGGKAMLMAAREALDRISGKKPLLIGVTVLTSHTQATLNEIGLTSELNKCIVSLTQLAQTAGLDGVVCSAVEAIQLRQACGDDFCLVTPGIRPENNVDHDDQQRVVTPAQATANGADYLVIGRPITRASDPMRIIKRINTSIG